MADGDIIHPGLSRRYQGLYKRVCQDIEDDESLARQALRCLKKDNDDYGKAPHAFLQQVASLFDQLITDLRWGLPVQWAQVRQEMKEGVRNFSGSDRGLQLALRACGHYLDILQREQPYGITPRHAFVELTQHYLLAIYDQRFEQRVGQTRDFYQGANPEMVYERLTQMRRYIMSGTAAFAQQLVEQKALRLPARSTKLRMIDYNNDLDRGLSELLRGLQ